MNTTHAIQKLLNGTVTEGEIQSLKQLLASGEISIGGNVSNSVIIQGSENNVQVFQLTPEMLELLGGHQLLGNLERDLHGDEIALGLQRLDAELTLRAPTLESQFQEQARRLRPTLKTNPNALSESARKERLEALAHVNSLCMEALDISFNAVATGEAPPEYEARCPFRGLESFRVEDREFFFGREELTRKLVGKIQAHSFLAVLGASGSGKSSLVMAGMIPALHLDYAVIRPGTSPLEALESARGKSLLVVDQFEELFTLAPDEKTRADFISALLDSTKSGKVIITLRSDFLSEAGAYRSLSEEIQSHLEIIPPMNGDELRRAMEGQARWARLEFEADLSQQILDDVAGEPGAMPLLQHALWELWKRRHGRHLRANEYRTFGGVKQAITSTAEKVYAECSKPEQEQIRDIFLRLTRLDEGDEGRDTRRRVPLGDLIPSGADSASISALLDKLANVRLIVKTVNDDKTEIEVAHEALIRHWERLRIWLNEDRDALRLRESVSEDARIWENSGRDESILNHRGGRLEDALSLGEDVRYGLTVAEQTYLNACVVLREREKAVVARRRRYAIAGVSVALVLIMAILVGWGITNKNQVDIAQTAQANAEEQAKISLSRQLSAQALTHLDDRFDLSLLLSVEALRHADTIESRNSLLAALQHQPQLIRFFYTDQAISSVSFSPDENYLVALGGDEIFIWEVATGNSVLVTQMIIGESKVFSGDGKVGYSIDYNDGIRLWDIENEIPLDFLILPAYPAYSRDGKMIAADETVNNDAKIVIRDTTTDSMIATLDDRDLLWPSILMFSPDGTKFAASSMQDGERQPGVLVWYLPEDPLDRPLDEGIFQYEDWDEFIHDEYYEITDMVFSPDSQFLAIMTENPNNSITAEGFGVLSGQKGFITSMGYSPGYPWNFASGSSDGTITLWNNRPYDNVDDVLVGTGDPVWALAFSPSGKFLASTGNSGFALWDILASPLLLMDEAFDSETSTIAPFINSVPETISYVSGETSVISTDGLWTAGSVCFDIYRERGLEMGMPCSRSTIHLIGQSTSYTLSGFYGMVTTLAFSPDAKILAAGVCNEFDQYVCYSGEVLLWYTTTGQPIGKAFDHQGEAISRIAFNQDNTILASGDHNGNVSLWNLDPLFWKDKACAIVGRNFTQAEWMLYFPDEPYPTKQEDATCSRWPLGPELTVSP